MKIETYYKDIHQNKKLVYSNVILGENGKLETIDIGVISGNQYILLAKAVPIALGFRLIELHNKEIEDASTENKTI